MAVNSISSSAATQAYLPPQKPEGVRQADAAKQAQQSLKSDQSAQASQADRFKQAAQENQPQPVKNTQGQTVGGTINTVA